MTETFQLKSKGNGYHMGYNDELPATTLNSMGNAVLPLILSLLPSHLELFTTVEDFFFILLKSFRPPPHPVPSPLTPRAFHYGTGLLFIL